MTTSKHSANPVRAAGVLLHPTSLPGPYGIGDLGLAAHAWVDALVHARQTWWQMLPLGPTGFGDSPYQCFSAFAGNPNLLSPDLLVRDGLLNPGEISGTSLPIDWVDYGRVIRLKRDLLVRVWKKFRSQSGTPLAEQFAAFQEAQAGWLEDYALFMALKEAHGEKSWQTWPRELMLREPGVLRGARRELEETVGLHRFGQFLFFRQWDELKRYAHGQGLSLIGDLPIFVSADSADVWANPDLFLLDEHRRPVVVAGVPPDYFSATGQLWGNPLYDWEVLKETGYAWWVARLRAALEQVDLVRLDHFRGFEAFWEVPAGRPTAAVGRWVRGPGAELLEALRAALGGLPLIAEDLGVITPEVETLRTQFGLPGMRILQFAFGGAIEKRFLPHRFDRHTVAYTGTHDNDTTRGWYASLTDPERRFFHRYVPGDHREVSWELIRLAWASVADLALTPLQDVLGLGTEARMNQPGTASGNWTWRFRAEMLTTPLLDRLRELTETYERISH